MTRAMNIGFGTMLLALLFMWTTSYAGDVPLNIKWSGTVVDDGFGLNANFIDAQASGSFGASNVSVLSEFTPGMFLCDADENGLPDEGVLPLFFAYARPVVTFANGDQLWGHVTEGWGCLSQITGYFTGEAEGVYDGGTGRFSDVSEATGSFVVSFEGNNITLPDLGVGYGAISGEITGTVEK
jgi:hypothetical protein